MSKTDTLSRKVSVAVWTNRENDKDGKKKSDGAILRCADRVRTNWDSDRQPRAKFAKRAQLNRAIAAIQVASVFGDGGP